jgi:hypothetical protein
VYGIAGNPVNNVAEDQFNRPEEFEKRRSQQISFHAFPTTSIGSFPQTAGKSGTYQRRSFCPLIACTDVRTGSPNHT